MLLIFHRIGDCRCLEPGKARQCFIDFSTFKTGILHVV